MSVQLTPRLSASLDHLASLVPARVEIHDLLAQVIGAVEGLFRLDGAGVMLADVDQVLRTALVTDERGSALERAQEATGTGPCVDAYVYARPVPCRDVCNDERYRLLGERLSDGPVTAVLGVPVTLVGTPVGVLNLFVDRGHDWTRDEIDGLSAYAEVLGRLLVTGLAARRSDELAGQLQRALDSRVMVERAIGYLMAREGIDATTSFHRLRGAARRRRVRVAELASSLLSTGCLP